MGNSTKFNLKNTLLTFCLLFVACLIGFFIAESVVRIFLPQSFTTDQFNPLLGWENTPNRSGYHTAECEEPVFIEINSKKMRGKEFDYKKEEGVFRILVLGDSFTAALNVPMEDTSSKLLEALLNSQYEEKTIEVINAGVGGYGTNQEFLYLKHELYKYKPDLILVNFFLNDVLDNLDTLAGKRPLLSSKNGELFLSHQPVAPPKIFQLLKRIFIDSHFAKLVFNTTGQILFKIKFEKIMQNQVKERTVITGLTTFPDFNLNKALDITKILFSELSNLAGKFGAKFAVFLIPSPYQLMDHYPDKISRLIKTKVTKEERKTDEMIFGEISSYLKQNGIFTIDPLSGFVEEAKLGNVNYFDFEYHWNIEGNRLAANIMFDYLVENNLVPPLESHRIPVSENPAK